jgi:hypothetical protein
LGLSLIQDLLELVAAPDSGGQNANR